MTDSIAVPETLDASPPPPAASASFRTPSESVSPFIAWPEDETEGSLEELVGSQSPSVFHELLSSPEAIAARLAGPEPRKVIELCLLVLVSACAFSGALLGMTLRDPVFKAALLIPLSLLIALVAALGPIAAVAIVLGVRVPWARLAGTLAAAMASGALATAAVTPIAVVLHRLDAQWAGPLAVILSFSVAGVVAGKRTRDLLLLLASAAMKEARRAELEEDELERVKMLARISTMIVAFTTALAIWALGALG